MAQVVEIQPQGRQEHVHLTADINSAHDLAAFVTMASTGMILILGYREHFMLIPKIATSSTV